jgi:hypothetical protein
MKFYAPKLVYEDYEEYLKDLKERKFILKYMSSRVINENANLSIAVTGQTGAGKSWACIRIGEDYSELTGIPFTIKDHVFHTAKKLLKLLNDEEAQKKIQIGSLLVFEEPQVEANSRDFHSITNRVLASLMSTFRNQRLVILFATPYFEMIDKQVRVHFHGDFRITGYNKDSKLTTIEPRFLDYNPRSYMFYVKKLKDYEFTINFCQITR